MGENAVTQIVARFRDVGRQQFKTGLRLLHPLAPDLEGLAGWSRLLLQSLLMPSMEIVGLLGIHSQVALLGKPQPMSR